MSGPDLLLTGGAVYTVDPARPWAQALAVRGGRIVAIGSVDELAELAGPRTRTIQLEGRMVLPGFQDAHLHPPEGGLSRLRCDLHQASAPEEYLQVVRRYAAQHPEREWIAGSGWSMDAFPGGTPTRSALDEVVPDRPVYLQNRDGHGAWVNGRALELAGVTGATPDPADGRIERDERGEPAGTLQEGAMRLVEQLVPAPTPGEWEQAILAAQAELHALGITAWQDARVTAKTLGPYRAVAERGALTMRCEGNLLWDRGRGDEQLPELLEARAVGQAGRLRLRGAKIFQDGVLENFTAALLEPYVGRDDRGLGMHEPAELAHIVTLLDAEGFQVHIHTIGDRAVREALDAIQAARAANGSRDARHHLAHVQLVHPDDLPRFGALGVVANAQPYWACRSDYVTELTEPFIGPERSRLMYPFASLRRAGAALAFGSDWTVSTPDPLPIVETAVTRASPDERDAEPLLPAEALDLPAALAAATLGSAHVNFLDGETGSLAVGKLADLAVLDKNLFELEGGHVADARVLATLVEGEVVAGELG